MGIIKPQRTIPQTTVRRNETHIVWASDEAPEKIIHRYEDGTVRIVEGAELDQVATGETVKTWRALARRLGRALDGDPAN